MRSVKQIIKILEIESEASGATVTEYKDIKQRIKKWSYTIEIKQ